MMAEEVSGIKTVSDEVWLKEPDSTCDNGMWKIKTENGALKLKLVNDAMDAMSTDIIINRKGMEIETIIYDGIVFTPNKKKKK